VLKAIGFSDRFVTGFVLTESLLIAALGGAIGLGAAKLMTMGGDITGGFLPIFFLPTRDVVAGAVLALIVGILAGIIPAVSAMRLRVVDALRRV